MRKLPDRIDENILAGYLSGNLPPRLRSEIASYLASDESSLELLGMAGAALNAADPEFKFQGSERKSTRRQRLIPAPKYIRTSRAALFTILTVLLVLAGLYLLNILGDLPSNSRTTSPNVDVQWSPVIGTDPFSLSWPSVEGAGMYVVVVMDPSMEEMLVRVETTNSSIPNILREMKSSLPRKGKILELWITAFDESGGLLRRSNRIPFTIGS